jgi:hypothetical protein
MATCPNGHESASGGVCALCGLPIAGGYDPPSVLGGLRAGPGPARGGEPCPRCGTMRVGQFCDACGYRFGSAQPPWAPAPPAAPPASESLSAPPAPTLRPPAHQEPPRSFQPRPWVPAPAAPAVPTGPRRYAHSGWMAVVSCDRVYHENVQAANAPHALVECPAHYAERRVSLRGNRMHIGRRSIARGVDPEIDLTGPPADPGVSRLHAVLIASADGGWSVMDPGSVNGTLVNGSGIPIGVQVPLRDGDRINLGGWTAITVHRG